MSKAYLLVLCLLLASFTGCTDDSEEEEEMPDKDLMRSYDVTVDSLEEVFNRMNYDGEYYYTKEEWVIHDISEIVEIDGMLMFGVTGKSQEDGYNCGLETWYIFPRESNFTPGQCLLSEKPAWHSEHVPSNDGALWAPNFHGSRTMYYTVPTSEIDGQEDTKSCIGMVIATGTAPNLVWTDHGSPIICQDEGEENNEDPEPPALDPAIITDDDGRVYMVYGGAHIWITELDSKTGEHISGEPWDNGDSGEYVHLANGPEDDILYVEEGIDPWIEAPYIHKEGDYYYLFVNWYGCCAGADSTYEIFVGRSDSVTGPYLDAEGTDMRNFGGKLVMSKESHGIIGPGHAGIFEYGTGEDKVQVFTHHYYPDDGMPWAYAQARMLSWKDGWPVVSQEQWNPMDYWGIGNPPGEGQGCIDYEDKNGNGLYDLGEPCNDTSTNTPIESSEDLAKQCLGSEHSNVIFHFHSNLILTVRGEEILIPNNMGIGTSVCPEGMHLLHTHTTYSESQPGAFLHIEAYESKTIPLSLFFEVWNISESDVPSFQPLFQDMDNVTITIDGVKQTLGMDEIFFEDGILIEVVFADGSMNGGGKPEDTYACNINSEGFCIFTGTPHKQGLEPGTDNIVDREGNYLFGLDEAVAANSEGMQLQARGTPAFDGDQLIQSSQEGMSEDEKAFHKVIAIMFPIRNALMYDIASLTQDEWDALVNELEIREIKETTFTDGQTPKDNYYGRQGIFDLAKDPDGKDIHHDVMKFLEESGLYLLCHVTSDDFAQMLADTHPEGHNPCDDAEITTKIPFAEETQDYNMTVTEVVDGDTFYLGNEDKVRMLGINTPESGRPYSEEATEFLTNMILGKEVTLVNDSKNGDSDSYGRLLAHVYVNDTFVNYEIIKAGYAFWYPYTSGTDFDSEYEEAQDNASNNMVGLWTQSPYNLTIDYIEYDPEGIEADGEYLVLTNHESYNVSMVGWFLQDEAAQTAYEFNFTISNNSSIRIYTGDGIDNSTTLYWGWHQGIWNNSGDFAIIQDENGYMVDSYRYD